jgi:hypothetical protein
MTPAAALFADILATEARRTQSAFRQRLGARTRRSARR